MAPVIQLPDDVSSSSLELHKRAPPEGFDLSQYLASLSFSEREALNDPPSSVEDPLAILKRSVEEATTTSPLSPIELQAQLTARDAATSTASTNPAAGSIPPNSVNMQAVQAVFAIIGASFVVTAIWFFFWAKNGGFRWRNGDWDDYKSTVLRRKGPDGKTLSNATKSTKLGGGSIVGSRYRDFEDDETSMGMTEVTKTYSATNTATTRNGGAGTRIKKMRERMAEKKARKTAAANMKKHMRDTEKAAKSRPHPEAWEGATDADVRAYRHERPARVGGLNKESDGQGTFYGGTEYSESANNDASTTYTGGSDYPRRSNRPSRHHNSNSTSNAPPAYNSSPRHPSPSKPTVTPVRPSGDYSQHHQHRHSPSQHSRQQSRQSSPVKQSRRSMPGSYADPLDMGTNASAPSEYEYGSQYTESESGTKSYHHPIPGLGGAGRSGGGGGFRRERRDSFD